MEGIGHPSLAAGNVRNRDGAGDDGRIHRERWLNPDRREECRDPWGFVLLGGGRWLLRSESVVDVKVRVNRGFAYNAYVGTTPSWTYNSTFQGSQSMTPSQQ